MKKCIKCGEKKRSFEFYKHSGMKDGYLNKCKTCYKFGVAAHRLENREYYLAYDKSRSTKPHRIKLREEYAKTKEGKEAYYRGTINYRASEKGKAFLKKYKERNREKLNARSKVAYALRTEKIKRKPCHICGKRKNIHAHHEDYSKPLDVKWMCARCHHAEHH